jgi:hypothetical protein
LGCISADVFGKPVTQMPMLPARLVVACAVFGGASAQFFQFPGGGHGGGINLEDLMGGGFGGGGHAHRGGYEELPQEEEEEEVDLYERLGIQPEATDREIKTSYRKLSIQYHPDKNQSPEAEVGRALHAPPTNGRARTPN